MFVLPAQGKIVFEPIAGELMFECLILGDGIGVGAAKEINARYARQRDVVAMERATADQILGWRKPPKGYGTCVFAIGSNDKPGQDWQPNWAGCAKPLSRDALSSFFPIHASAHTSSIGSQYTSATRRWI